MKSTTCILALGAACWGSVPNGALAQIPLGQAVNATNLVWTSGGATNWFGQALIAFDAASAAQSGKLTHNQETWMATSVVGPGTVSFWWKVGSEEGCDFLEFYVGDALQEGRISGLVDWQHKSFEVPSGTNTLKWRYVKDDTVNSYPDCGWLDQVIFSPAPPESLSLSSPVRLADGSVQFSVLVGNAFSCRVQYSTNQSSTNWLTLTNFPAHTDKTVVDPSATSSGQRFYRAVSP